MRRTWSLMILGVVLACGFLTTAGASAQSAGANPEGKRTKNPVAASAQSIAQGQATYQKYCRFCHGDNAKGDGPQAPKGSHPPDLTDAKWDRGASDGEIFAAIENTLEPKDPKEPKPVMKGYKGKLTDEQIWNVVNFLRSLVPQAQH